MEMSDNNQARTLYVSDLDGTLLGDDSRLSRGTIDMLNRIIEERGGLFTVATARTPATVVPLMHAPPAVHRHRGLGDVESRDGEF